MVFPKTKNWIEAGVLLTSYPSILIRIDHNELIPVVRPGNESTLGVHQA